jgi:hypothetical protein
MPPAGGHRPPSPPNTGYLDTLAEVLFQRGDEEKAIELMKKAIELNGKNVYLQKQLQRFEVGDRNVDIPGPCDDDLSGPTLTLEKGNTMAPTDLTLKATALSSEDARRAVNRWSAGSFFRIPKWGDRIQIDKVVPYGSHTIHVWSEHEKRSVSRESQPYHGGEIDDRGTPPDCWSIAVRRPADYEDRTETIPVPHTEQVETCSGCNGAGNITCTNCRGWGKVDCPSCNGKGYRERTVTRTEAGADAQTITRVETVRDNCSCFGGKVNCGTCQGHGKVPCRPCAGSGRVKTFDQVTVQFRVSHKTEVLNATEVPSALMKQASGKVLLVEEGERVAAFSNVTPEVDQQARTMLHDAQVESQADTRLLFQRLRIEQVAVHEVTYHLGHSPTRRRLWVFGEQEQVHAPGAPWAWWRLAAIIGGVVVVIVGAVFFLTR